MRILTFSLILCMMLHAFHSQSAKKSLTVSIADPNDKSKYTQKDLIEYIEEGSRIISNASKARGVTSTQKKAIVILGMSGTGKSTLVNYLNEIPLICYKRRDNWILDLKYQNLVLPGGFAIGHKTSSQTRVRESKTNTRIFKYTHLITVSFDSIEN